jgi:hypothetical protein
MDYLAVADQKQRTKQSKDMQRMPPTTEPLSRNFLDETFFWSPADQKERQAVQAHRSPGTPRSC